MTDKQFLPRNIYNKNPVIEEISKHKSTYFKSCFNKSLPCVGIFMLFFGTTFLNFSLNVIHDGYIGYYDHEVPKYYNPGIYLKNPWHNDFNILNVQNQNISIGNINNSSFPINLITVEYKPKDIKKYLTTILLHNKIYSFLKVFKNELKETIINTINSTKIKPKNLTINIDESYGLEIIKIYLNFVK